MIKGSLKRSFGPRRTTIIGIAVVALICATLIGLDPIRLLSSTNFKLTWEFLSAALSPALEYEKPIPGADPFLKTVLESVLITLRFAVLAISVSIPVGAILTFFSTSAWWPNMKNHRTLDILVRGLHVLSRTWIAFARSIHELIWGILFITAMGLSTNAAIVAVVIPFSGILAKIYSEILEEHSREAQELLRSIGAGSLVSFSFGLVPKALPDIVSYTFYRLECAIRTAAVFGFVGIETIGYRIKLSSDEFHYHEVWTYLYALFGTIALLEWWGSAIRRNISN